MCNRHFVTLFISAASLITCVYGAPSQPASHTTEALTSSELESTLPTTAEENTTGTFYTIEALTSLEPESTSAPADDTTGMTVMSNHYNNTDPCHSNPCLNSGTCYSLVSDDDVTSYQCICESGFTGDICGNRGDMDPCKSIPCLNGGLCIPDLNNDSNPTFTCKCTDDFMGRKCEESSSTTTATSDLCSSEPCLNGGRCYNIDTSKGWIYTCSCRLFTYGHNCESTFTADDPCAGNPCAPGTCIVTNVRFFYCACPYFRSWACP